ncbi:MAG: hypothetical protein KF799_11180 [Bdellovibrionales bacterium]|nr:hypothetical protein [Bdellovibrionales bacterium]
MSLLFVFLSLSSAFARTEECEARLSFRLEAAQERTLSFRDTEVFRRNNDFGMQQQGDLHFDQWFDLPTGLRTVESFLGLNSEGRIYHVVQWQGRRIARLLSGRLNFKKIWLGTDKILVAADANDRVYLFSPQMWMKPAGKGKVMQSMLIWAATTAAVTAGTAFATDVTMQEWPLFLSAIATTSGLNSMFIAIYRFDRDNTFPNGFVPTNLSAANLSQLREQLLERDLKLFMAGDHFAPPELESLSPQIPREALEAIR